MLQNKWRDEIPNSPGLMYASRPASAACASPSPDACLCIMGDASRATQALACDHCPQLAAIEGAVLMKRMDCGVGKTISKRR